MFVKHPKTWQNNNAVSCHANLCSFGR